MTDLSDLIALRHSLHRHPEVSRAEQATAALIAKELQSLQAAEVIEGLGGHGVAAVFHGRGEGPTVMLRAELDALPIAETSGVGHASLLPGRGHLCGHDGHMAILMGVAQKVALRPLARGRLVCLFQPAEEDGSGAAAVLADPAFAALRPDWAFALHNMPGQPLGAARVSAGPSNCASVGLRLRFLGRTAHAATPQTGLSPVPAVLALVPAVQALSRDQALVPGFRLVTLTHVRIGEPTFGIAPGEAEVFLTLRCMLDADMAALRAEVMRLAEAEAAAHGLELMVDWHDDFAACHNDAEAVARIEKALLETGTPFGPAETMRASEDFGRFGGSGTKSAMFLLGAGEQHPALHDPNYDFPDAIIPVGVAVFTALVEDLLD
ncbi:amidohydrolase [Thioclava sp. FR2]|uniref:amidohydrolase n=1 Tax=Thioclava sp. FR2 TaxID=3445780 RepID=UPI003EBD8FC8